ncbi:MAG TPA: hypothetical protein VGP08_00455 [Pyrinomonadaceae bacterium]|jgi:hypothetical protein|nr:hypothetical protein [Pyrinomonadaceae bacterium]
MLKIRNKHAQLSITSLTIFSLLAACGGLSSKQEAAIANAMKALQKLNAATEIGVNYQSYQPLLIEAKAQVNDAESVLPDGELKSELSAAMDAYADAGDAWGAFIREGKGDEVDSFLLLNKIESFMPVTEGQATARRLREKYRLQTTDDIASILTNRLSEESKHNAIIRSKTLPVIWGVAKEHVDRASKLLED